MRIVCDHWAVGRRLNRFPAAKTLRLQIKGRLLSRCHNRNIKGHCVSALFDGQVGWSTHNDGIAFYYGGRSEVVQEFCNKISLTNGGPASAEKIFRNLTSDSACDVGILDAPLVYGTQQRNVIAEYGLQLNLVKEIPDCFSTKVRRSPRNCVSRVCQLGSLPAPSERSITTSPAGSLMKVRPSTMTMLPTASISRILNMAIP
jgi:hypothetical protein